MKPLCRKPVLLLVFFAAVISGCARKKPVLVVPTEQPPVVAPTPAPTPEAKAEPSPTPAATPAEQPANPETNATNAEPPAKTKPHSRPRATVKKPSPAVKAEEQKPAEPRSTPAPISPTISPGDAARDQASTEQLLQSTEANLNGIKRQLSKEEQAMVTQIHSFINQSRQASKDNDPARARTLAMKANLLSNELIRR